MVNIMKLAKTLSRNEMKNIMAGSLQEPGLYDGGCPQGCSDFSGVCYQSCIDTFEPHQDIYAYCVNTCKKQVDFCFEGCQN